MKNLIKSLFVIAIISTFTISCSNDNDELNNDVQEFATMDLLLAEMNAKAKENGKPITFDIIYQNNAFSVNNLNVIDTFEEEFAYGYAKNGDPQPGDVTVTCTDDPDNPTLCPAGEGQGNCVGSAVIACISTGECAEVCPVSASLMP